MIAALQSRNLAITVAEATVTAAAAAVVMLAGPPAWVMFVGWISYYTRGVTPRDGVLNIGGVLIGLVIGLAAALVLQLLGPEPTLAERIAVIFGVALVVLSLRFLRHANNLLAFFLGLVTFFASHAEPVLAALVPLAGTATIGAVADALANQLKLRLKGS